MRIGFGPSKIQNFFPFFKIKVLDGGGVTNVR